MKDHYSQPMVLLATIRPVQGVELL